MSSSPAANTVEVGLTDPPYLGPPASVMGGAIEAAPDELAGESSDDASDDDASGGSSSREPKRRARSEDAPLFAWHPPASRTARAVSVAGLVQGLAVLIGAVAVSALADGLGQIPYTERVLIRIATIGVGMALIVGGFLLYTLRGWFVLAGGAAGSLLLSVYWALVRPPLAEFPVIPLLYALPALLILGMLLLAKLTGPPATDPGAGPGSPAAPSPTPRKRGPGRSRSARRAAAGSAPSAPDSPAPPPDPQE